MKGKYYAMLICFIIFTILFAMAFYSLLINWPTTPSHEYALINAILLGMVISGLIVFFGWLFSLSY